MKAQVTSFQTPEELTPLLNEGAPCVVHALGRSYGDSAVAECVVSTKRYRRILSFDEASGTVVCESGIGLYELIDAFLPYGYFPAVTPGTKFVSVGGAIASDIHGKNHHVAGCFSECVDWFDLLLPGGTIKRCSKTQNKELFLATCGGMGLTGIILTVSLKLAKVDGAFIDQRVVKAKNLEDIFWLFEELKELPYSVAWIDCLAKGEKLGRSLLMVGDHAESGKLRSKRKPEVTIPFEFPSFALNPTTVKLFNELYYNKVRKTVTEGVVDLNAFFYPLDAVLDWNKIYGKGGFTQYQFVLPKEQSYEGMKRILEKISEAGLGSFLAVLKLFGKANDNYLSFPTEGFTLALDFKLEPKLYPLLDELDELVLEYGGRLYLTKDVRMKPEMLEAGYPKLSKFRRVRSKYGLMDTFQSLQSKRLGL
jgi:FAD/FMN-containing dehydrogenase